MPRDLPPLNAIRVFECAARHLNFTKAAEELFVTQGAVSRQIKQLEEDLQQTLFMRNGPKLQLTPVAERYHVAIQEGLGIIRRGTRDIRQLSAKPRLTVSVLPSFAANWFVPRIVGYQHDNPGLDLRVAASYEPVDFRRCADVDVAIRLGRGNWPGLYTECLISEQLFPVCSPALLRDRRVGNNVRDILKLPLIFASERYDEWDRWFEAAGVEMPREVTGTRYNDQLLLFQAAIEGQGVILARGLLVEQELRNGRLVSPFDLRIPSLNDYYFVCPEGDESEPKIHSFLSWLRKQALATNSACNTACETEDAA